MCTRPSETKYVGEELCCRAEEDNAFDRSVVAISKDGRIFSHVTSITGKNFLVLSRHSSVTCRITDVRRQSEVEDKGLVVSCVYIFLSKTNADCHISKHKLST